MVIGRKGGPRTRQSTVVRALKEKIGKIKKNKRTEGKANHIVIKVVLPSCWGKFLFAVSQVPFAHHVGIITSAL